MQKYVNFYNFFFLIIIVIIIIIIIIRVLIIIISIIYSSTSSTERENNFSLGYDFSQNIHTINRYLRTIKYVRVFKEEEHKN